MFSQIQIICVTCGPLNSVTLSRHGGAGVDTLPFVQPPGSASGATGDLARYLDICETFAVDAIVTVSFSFM